MNLKRTLTAFILFSLLLLALIKGNIFILSLIILLVGFLCFYEWKNLYQIPFWLWISGEILLIIGFILIFIFNLYIFYIFYLFLSFSFILFLFNFDKNFFKTLFFPFLIGIVYIFIGLYPFWEILNFFERKYLIYFFSVIFANDTGAYLVGNLIGKTPFFSKISPKKTWEGFLGGLFFALSIAFFLNQYFYLFSVKFNILLSISLAIAGSIGDLLESAFKRIMGKKDSGKIIIGHGGILDRIDSVLLSSPLFLFFLKTTFK